MKQNGEPLTEPIPVDAGEAVPHCASKELLPPEADGKGFEYAALTSTTAKTTTGKLHGYDAQTGKEVWSFERESLSIDAPPIAYESTPSFKGQLSPAEIKSVATFVSKSAGKG